MPKQTLEDRIAAFRGELEAFVEERAREVQKGTGLPIGTIMQVITGGSQCRCAVAQKVIAERKRDEEIAARQA